MAKARFERTKPHVNVGTIGHVGPWEDDVDGCDHEASGAEGDGGGDRVRRDRQGAGGAASVASR